MAARISPGDWAIQLHWVLSIDWRCVVWDEVTWTSPADFAHTATPLMFLVIKGWVMGSIETATMPENVEKAKNINLIWKLVFHLKLIRLQLFSLSKDILKQWKKEFLKCSDYCLTSGGITPTKVHMGMPTLKLTNTVSPVSLLYKNNRAKSSLKNWVDKQRFWNLFTLGLAYIYIFMNNTFCLSR